MPVSKQALVLFADELGHLDDVDVERIGSFESALLAYANSNHADFMKDLAKSGDYNDSIKDQLKAIVENFKKNGAW